MKVLVLCHGNINRSPFVEAILRRERPGWEVRSAGLKTRDGRRASRKAREAAERRGLSLEEHRSCMLHCELVEWVISGGPRSKILYMDGGNEIRLRGFIEERYRSDSFQRVWNHCALLASYGSLRRIPDPNYTSDPELLRRYFSMAEDCAVKFVEANR